MSDLGVPLCQQTVSSPWETSELKTQGIELSITHDLLKHLCGLRSASSG